MRKGVQVSFAGSRTARAVGDLSLRMKTILLLGALLVATRMTAFAQSGASPAKNPPPTLANEPAFAPVSDDPKLPRVLLIGDSISIGYTLPVRKLLAGKANVHRP